jgi:hypothetical protein
MLPADLFAGSGIEADGTVFEPLFLVSSVQRVFDPAVEITADEYFQETAFYNYLRRMKSPAAADLLKFVIFRLVAYREHVAAGSSKHADYLRQLNKAPMALLM